MRTKFWPGGGGDSIRRPKRHQSRHAPIPCISPIAKKLRIFLFYPLFSRFQKNYSLVLNFTPYFHEQGVDYPFGKTLVRALPSYIYYYTIAIRGSMITGK